MGLFSKKQAQSEQTYECKLCGHSVPEAEFDRNTGICHLCGVTADSFVSEFLMPVIKASLENAREEQNPDSKIIYFRSLLDALYEYKVKYHDTGIDLIEQDIDELIDRVIDLISRVRTERRVSNGAGSTAAPPQASGTHSKETAPVEEPGQEKDTEAAVD